MGVEAQPLWFQVSLSVVAPCNCGEVSLPVFQSHPISWLMDSIEFIIKLIC